jgi:glycosyltransferase involved in cell wall biosynthesis
MRILYASERPPYPFFLGGAARCAHRLLYALTHELGANCVAVGSSDYRVTPWSYPDPSDHAALGILAASREGQGGRIDCGYPICVFPDFRNELGRYIETFEPDVVWAQLEEARFVIDVARSKGVQGLLFVHDAEFDPAELRSIGDLGCHVVCSSGFLAERARAVIGRAAHVVYPCPETSFGVVADPHGCITMINPHRVKGLETFIEVARRMPAEKFLLVESWKLTDPGLAALGKQLASAPNVRFLRRVSDMRQIYGQTKLLLVPSVWEEGFGMVAVEAQSCRIPVVASARGGLPESVGDGGLLIDDYLDADAWVGAIGDILNDAGRYDDYAIRAARHAASEEFTTSFSARRFHDVCSSKLRPRGAVSRGLRALAEGLDTVPGLGKMLRQINR